MSGSLIHTRTPLDEALSAQVQAGPRKVFISKVVVPGLLRFGMMARDEGCAVCISEGRFAVSIAVLAGEVELLNLAIIAHMEADGVRAQAFKRPSGTSGDADAVGTPFLPLNDLPDPLTPESLYDLLCMTYREALPYSGSQEL